VARQPTGRKAATKVTPKGAQAMWRGSCLNHGKKSRKQVKNMNLLCVRVPEISQLWSLLGRPRVAGRWLPFGPSWPFSVLRYRALSSRQRPLISRKLHGIHQPFERSLGVYPWPDAAGPRGRTMCPFVVTDNTVYVSGAVSRAGRVSSWATGLQIWTCCWVRSGQDMRDSACWRKSKRPCGGDIDGLKRVGQADGVL